MGMSYSAKRRAQWVGIAGTLITILVTSVSAQLESCEARRHASRAETKAKTGDVELDASYKALSDKLDEIERHTKVIRRQAAYLDTRQTLLEQVIMATLSSKPAVRAYKPPPRPNLTTPESEPLPE